MNNFIFFEDKQARKTGIQTLNSPCPVPHTAKIFFMLSKFQVPFLGQMPLFKYNLRQKRNIYTYKENNQHHTPTSRLSSFSPIKLKKKQFLTISNWDKAL